MAKAETEPGAKLATVPEPGPMVRAIVQGAELPPVDSAQAERRIIAAIVAAESPEALIEAGQAVSAEDILGVPIEVHDCELRPSTIKGEGLDCFMVCDCIDGRDGSQFVLTTSAQNVMLRLAVAKDRGWLPLAFKIEKADRETAKGFTPYVVKAI